MLDQIKKKYEEVTNAHYEADLNREQFIKVHGQKAYDLEIAYYRGQIELMEEILVENHAKFSLYDAYGCYWHPEEQF